MGSGCAGDVVVSDWSMWAWFRTRRLLRHGERPLRAIGTPNGDPYREQTPRPDLERTSEPVSLPLVLSALERAGVRYRQVRRGFDLLGPRGRMLPVRVPDPDHVVPAELRCGSDAPELVLDLALALVSLFGPLLADVKFAGSIVVDGRRDRRELGDQAAMEIQRVGQRLAMHAPIAVPILLELARRMRDHTGRPTGGS